MNEEINNTPGKPSKYSDKIMFVNMSEQISPTFTINKSKEYVLWGTDNLWPKYLQELLFKSPIHKSIIDRKTKMTYGNGFFIANENELTPAQVKKVKLFLDNVNEFDTLNDILKKTAGDFQLYGGFAWQVIYSKDKSKIVGINHIDMADLRSGKLEDGRVNQYFISDDWAKLGQNPYENLNAFNLKKPGGSQIMFIKNYLSGSYYYPAEYYRGALNAINTDYYISNYHLNHLRRGLTPTVVFNFVGPEPTEQEQAAIYNKIQKLYSNTDNAGKFILTFSDTDQNKTSVTPIQISDADKQFLMLNDYVKQGIFMGHNITSPMLFADKTAGQLGGRNEIITQSELFYNDVISQDQMLIEEALEKILAYNGLDFAKVQIKRSQSVKFMWSEGELAKITSINERRRMIDLPESVDANANTIGDVAPTPTSPDQPTPDSPNINPNQG